MFCNFLIKILFVMRVEVLTKKNFFCYISNLEHRLFSSSPLLHLPPLSDARS